MKPYQTIPIQDCGESLVPIPRESFKIVNPHPYVKLGANYAGKSPYFLRQSVLSYSTGNRSLWESLAELKPAIGGSISNNSSLVIGVIRTTFTF
jgi:hypothetical protein